ncbi:flavodoxin-dependent (E)-4-hydroxy-3-methylbut-2-enyl-diphosphate synthase [Calderihabitans maritimus]|uniref:flavodoxin-dependent (E)-4-hydroxy-3-methylbut-2-enyl-diphosphate synthase n=1 Tax=Calderihabitans maritimus TaxID=1246530 RepID=UPI000B508851
MERRKTRPISIGKVTIGGNAPIVVQSMTNTDTRDVETTVKQIKQLETAGCELVRVAVPDTEAAAAIPEIKKRINIPLIGDIHFDYRLAIQAIKNGVDGLRINPGNIGGKKRVQAVVKAARDYGVPIRIGVNAGSLERDILEKHGAITPEAMVESALKHIHLLEEEGFYDIKISLKASHVPLMVEAYRLLARQVDYPFHVGVTEAGTFLRGTVKSAVGIGILLAEGIGDTIRVSLTGDPVQEVRVAYEILKSLDLRRRGVELISCPTCGRCEIDLVSITEKVEEKLEMVDKPLQVAVMGCVVNGPGEARHADIGIAGGRGVGLLFKKGKIVKKVPEAQLVDALLKEIDNMLVEEGTK